MTEFRKIMDSRCRYRFLLYFKPAKAEVKNDRFHNTVKWLLLAKQLICLKWIFGNISKFKKTKLIIPKNVKKGAKFHLLL